MKILTGIPAAQALFASLSFFFLQSLLPVSAQNPPHTNFTVEDGLESNHIYDIYFSGTNEMWLGTESGLVHFDGVNFTSVYYEGGELPLSLMAEDPDGRIYVWSFDGKLLYEQDDTLYRFPVDEYVRDFRIVDDRIYVLHEDKLVFYSLEGAALDTFTAGTELFLTFLSDSVISARRGQLIFLDGTVIQDTLETPQRPAEIEGGLFTYNRERRHIYQIFPDHTERAFMGQTAKLPKCASTCFKSFDDRILYGSYCGIGDLNSGYRMFSNLPVSDIERDFEGNYWLATLGEGLIMIPYFELIEYEKTTAADPVRLDRITSGPGGEIFVFGNGNIYKLNLKKRVLEHYFSLPETKEVEGIFWDESAQTFLAECNGLHAISVRQNTPSLVPIENAYSKSISKFRDRHFIWSNFSYFVINPFGKTYDSHWIDSLKIPHRLRKSSYQIRLVGPAWTEKLKPTTGLYNPGKDHFVLGYADSSYILSRSGPMPLFAGEKPLVFSTICLQSDSGYFASGADIGIQLINHHGKCREILPPAAFSGKIPRKTAFHRGILWVLFQDRLLKFNPETHQAEWLNGADGFSFRGFRDILVTDTSVFLATTHSVIEVPTGLKFENVSEPVSLNMEAWADSRMLQPGEQIPFGAESTFRFHAINYRSRGQFSYYCRLQGFEKKFRSVGSGESKLSYGKLPPGDYVFEVFASNANGIRSDIRRLSFSVIPPLWQRWWFILLSASLLLSVIFLITRWIVINNRRMNHIRNMMLESRLNAIKKQMNPHFIFNCLASIQELVLSSNIKDSTLYLGKFSRLLRRVMEHNEAGSVSLSQEAELLDLYLRLEQLRMGDSFRYTIEIDPVINPDQLSIPPLLIQPYVENAVKHGLLHKSGEKILKISFRLAENDPGGFICIVEDNGIGRTASSEIRSGAGHHKPFATRANQNRLNIYKNKFPRYFKLVIKDKVLPSGEAAGTTVSLLLPVDFS